MREAKAAADAEILRTKQALTEAEQRRQEAVRQSEAEAHRSSVKLAQASRSLKAARQETADAHKAAKVRLMLTLLPWHVCSVSVHSAQGLGENGLSTKVASCKMELDCICSRKTCVASHASFSWVRVLAGVQLISSVFMCFVTEE